MIYLGMRVRTLRGVRTLRAVVKQIESAAAAKPDGLLHHEMLWFSLVPPHGGARPYWRDFDALERWARSFPHKEWWSTFLRDSRGTGFWHETYFLRGGMEAIYEDLPGPLGLLAFAPAIPAKQAMFSARRRLGFGGEEHLVPVLSEGEIEDSSIR